MGAWKSTWSLNLAAAIIDTPGRDIVILDQNAGHWRSWRRTWHNRLVMIDEEPFNLDVFMSIVNFFGERLSLLHLSGVPARAKTDHDGHGDWRLSWGGSHRLPAANQQPSARKKL